MGASLNINDLPKERPCDWLRFYQCVVLRSTNSAKTAAAFSKQCGNVLRNFGNNLVVRHEDWGVKNCASPVKGNKKAHFTLLYISTNCNGLEGFGNALKLDDDVLRHCFFKVDFVPEDESDLATARREKEAMLGEGNV